MSETEEIQAEWQNIVDILASICHVPSAIITRFRAPEIDIVRASSSAGNPYSKGLSVTMNGHYCEGIFRTAEKLRVENAETDSEWNMAPEIKYGMVAYLGYPIRRPDQSLYGTLCILDNKENEFSEEFERLLHEFKKVIEAHLQLMEQKSELERQNAEIRTLQGILPICMKCKKIRNDQGYWDQLEDYISEHSEALFSHGFCPECGEEYTKRELESLRARRR